MRSRRLRVLRGLAGGAAPHEAGDALLLEGDEQANGDNLTLEGDEQAGTDVLLLEPQPA